MFSIHHQIRHRSVIIAIAYIHNLVHIFSNILELDSLHLCTTLYHIGTLSLSPLLLVYITAFPIPTQILVPSIIQYITDQGLTLILIFLSRGIYIFNVVNR